MSKRLALVGVGNAITDILVQVDQATFDTFGLKRGSFQLVSPEQQERLLEALEGRQMSLISGGAVCNSIILASQLGISSAFVCRVGDDRYGLHYLQELSTLGIEVPSPPIVRERSGTSVIMITPDGERTMSTCLQASADLNSGDLSGGAIESAAWVFIEGYLLGNGKEGQGAVRRAIELARSSGTKIALTLAAPFIVEVFRDIVSDILPSVDLVFANHEEAMVYTKTDSVQASIAALSKECPHTVVTEGAQGVHIIHGGERHHVPAVPCTPVDLTGAGDAFAGGYLYGLHTGASIAESATGACYLASKVIGRIGARLPHGAAQTYWREVVAAQ
jgi:sugar/nucleoside kinase (ribokinase family)